MTDYSTWVLKNKHEKLLFGPLQDKFGDWAWVVEYEDGSVGAYTSDDRGIATDFEPPEPEWTYYRESRVSGKLHAITWMDTATHLSKDGGDTIERIK